MGGFTVGHCTQNTFYSLGSSECFLKHLPFSRKLHKFDSAIDSGNCFPIMCMCLKRCTLYLYKFNDENVLVSILGLRYIAWNEINHLECSTKSGCQNSVNKGESHNGHEYSWRVKLYEFTSQLWPLSLYDLG